MLCPALRLIIYRVIYRVTNSGLKRWRRRQHATHGQFKIKAVCGLTFDGHQIFSKRLTRYSAICVTHCWTFCPGDSAIFRGPGARLARSCECDGITLYGIESYSIAPRLLQRYRSNSVSTATGNLYIFGRLLARTRTREI